MNTFRAFREHLIGSAFSVAKSLYRSFEYLDLNVNVLVQVGLPSPDSTMATMTAAVASNHSRPLMWKCFWTCFGPPLARIMTTLRKGGESTIHGPGRVVFLSRASSITNCVRHKSCSPGYLYPVIFSIPGSLSNIRHPDDHSSSTELLLAC
jgi:hypothetical protein